MTLPQIAPLDPGHIVHSNRLHDLLNGRPWLNVKSYLYGAEGDGSTDDTAAILSAIDDIPAEGATVYFPPGTYKITDELVLPSFTTIWLSPQATVKQDTANKVIFHCEDLDDTWLHCFRGVLYGEGTWDPTWTGNQHVDAVGHRGVNFFNCRRSGMTYPVFKNFANSAWCIAGGSGVEIWNQIVIGTHNFVDGTVLPAEANFQNGGIVDANATWGDYDNHKIIGVDIRDTAQGVVFGESGGATAGICQFDDYNIHDLPGQHGLYIAASRVKLGTGVVARAHLSAAKVQASSTVPLVEDVDLGVIDAIDCGSQAFDIVGADGGEVRRVSATRLKAIDCVRGLQMTGKVTSPRLWAVEVDGVTQHGLNIAHDDTVGSSNPADYVGLEDGDIGALVLRNIGRNGALIQDAGVGANRRLKIGTLKIREPNQETVPGGSYYGVVTSGGNLLNVEVDELDVSDADANMIYGLFHSAGGFRINNRSIVSGAVTAPIRADVALGKLPAVRGQTSVADAGTITHGLGLTPTWVRVTGSVAGEIVSVTARGSTTFTVAIKTHAGAAGTTQTVYWEAGIG